MLFLIEPLNFDWLSAGTRLLVNLAFIGIMIALTARHVALRRYSFTFLMISIIVYFLCYTLKNFDLNLGMALGLFAIFGIIRYRTEPLQTEEMTYLFITIGMAVINALSDAFLSLAELSFINAIVLLIILFGERILMKMAYKNHTHPFDEKLERRIVLQMPYQENDLHAYISEEVKKQEKNLQVKIKTHKIFKIDQSQNIVVVHLYY